MSTSAQKHIHAVHSWSLGSKFSKFKDIIDRSASEDRDSRAAILGAIAAELQTCRGAWLDKSWIGHEVLARLTGLDEKAQDHIKETLADVGIVAQRPGLFKGNRFRDSLNELQQTLFEIETNTNLHPTQAFQDLVKMHREVDLLRRAAEFKAKDKSVLAEIEKCSSEIERSLRVRAQNLPMA